MTKYIDDKGLKRFAGNVDDQINNARYSILSTKGRANGIASLDSKGFVPLDQLGNLDMTFFEPVQELPTKDIKKHIYLIKNNKEGEQDTYDEYLYTGDVDGEYDASKWEKLGNFVPTFDLKDYAKKVEGVIALKILQSESGECKVVLDMADGSTKETEIPLASAELWEEPLSARTSKPSTPLVFYRNGLMSGSDKEKLDQIDTEALSQSISNANTATSNTNEAIRKCETATAGAEKCNVTLDGSVISVTDREGEVKTIDVIGPGEKVVVYVSSSVEGLSVAGLKINVYLNNGKTPQTYTTDSEGVAKFEVDRGNYYEVVFPEFGNAQAITPVGFTSVLGARDIRVEYKSYSMDETEEATISVMKYDEGNGAAFVGAKVSVTIGEDTQEYTTDDNGKVFVYVPYGKDYAVSVKDQDAYFVRYAKNDRTYTAKLPKRSIVYTMYQYKTGILVVDDSLNEYFIDDWLADGKSPDDAVAIRVAEQQLLLNGGSFLFRISDLKDLSKLPSRQWCTQNIQFNSIALNGNSVKDENYYRGETSTFLIRQEAEERSLSIPAFDYAWNQELVIGNQHLRGFLMSVGQEYIHIANRVEIGEVLRKLFGDEIADAYLTFVTSKNRWTSTQYSAGSAWSCYSQALSSTKYVSYYVLPVFAC